MKKERALVEWIASLGEHMSMTGCSLEVALREMSQSPGKELDSLLAPLQKKGETSVALIEIAKKSRSALIEQTMVLLLLARGPAAAMIDLINDVVVPIGDAQIQLLAEGAA